MLPSADTRWLTAADGIRLFVRQYRPAAGEGARTLLWCHGIGEHGGRYEHIVHELLSCGWQVIIPDLRGHGLSAGIRADVTSFENYLTDFDAITTEFGLMPERTALFGHSFGGLVITRWVQTRPRNWGAIVLSAPLLGIAVPIPAWKWRLGHLLAGIAPRTHLRTGLRDDNMSSDPAFLAARKADPMIQRSVTVRWFFSMLTALNQARADAAKLTVPILILQGTGDETTDPDVPADWLRSTRSINSRMVSYPGGLHELLNDRNWRTVCAEMLDWLEQQVPA